VGGDAVSGSLRPSATGSLVLIVGPYVGSPDGEELLRIVTGMAACGDDLTLAEVGEGVGALARDDLSAEAERYVEGLASLGIEAVELDARSSKDTIRSAARILVLSGPERSRVPSLLVLDDDYLERTEPRALIDALTNAGGVIRV